MKSNINNKKIGLCILYIIVLSVTIMGASATHSITRQNYYFDGQYYLAHFIENSTTMYGLNNLTFVDDGHHLIEYGFDVGSDSIDINVNPYIGSKAMRIYSSGDTNYFSYTLNTSDSDFDGVCGYQIAPHPTINLQLKMSDASLSQEYKLVSDGDNWKYDDSNDCDLNTISVTDTLYDYQEIIWRWDATNDTLTSYVNGDACHTYTSVVGFGRFSAVSSTGGSSSPYFDDIWCTGEEARPIDTTIITFIPTLTNISKNEGENISFDIDVTQDPEEPEVNIFQWMLNGVSQSFNKAWIWVIGQQDAGNHTIIGIANDTIGEVARQTYNVEVAAVNVEPGTPTSLVPNRGEYDIAVVTSCGKVNDPDGDIVTYEIQKNSGSGWTTIAINEHGITILDLTEYDYNTTIDLQCRASDGIYTSDWFNPPGEITRAENFMFFVYDHRTLPIYTENKPYQLGVYANTANENINITAVSFDCNGDRLTDYYVEYDEGIQKTNEYFTCVNLPGSVPHIATINLQRTNTSIQWQNACKSNELNCTIERIYNLKVI